MILLLFFCSGATALIYEVVWSKYLALMFGSTIQAQTVVLAVFMGGLALGNRIFGRRADLLQDPLAGYGYIEVVIGLYAFFFDPVFGWVDRLFGVVGAPLLDQRPLLLIVKGLFSTLLLLGPTVLMGGTLPLIAAWLQRGTTDPGRRSARFYSVNSLGAVFGAGLAGFILVRELGLVATLQATAFANVLIGIVAVAVARRRAFHGSARVQKPLETPAPPVQSLAWGGALVALTGAVSMGLQVLASRSLTLIFGASLQAFSTVLMAFILGIGLGSAVVASPRMKRFYNERTAALLLLLAAIWIGGFVNTIEFWTILYAKARTGLASTEAGYLFNQFLIAAISIVVLGIPAGLLGAVLPLCIGIVSGAANALGDQVGRLLTWNTLGAVAGVLGTGFILMPTAGLRGALLTLAILLSLVALLSFRAHRAMPGVGASAMVAGLLLWMVFSGDALWRHVLASGIFRLRANHVDWDSIRLRAGAIKLLFYKDAADATVSVETTIRKREKEDLVLRINGKPDASTVGDISTQYLLAHLPMMARPQATDVFVLGFGSGITAGALLEHPIAHLTIAENCQPILDAAPLFEPWNRGVLTNSRTRLYMEDARTVLKLSPQAYDVIISEPSNPWVAGIGSVFSREFYELAAGRLKDGGVMAQWFHIYEMHDGIVFLVLRTFGSVFPHMEIWDTLEGDMVILGSKTPWKSSPEIYRQVYERGGVKRDLETLGLGRPELVWARQIASQATAPFIAGEGPIQSDGFPLLEYIAPEAFYVGAHARQIFYFDERTWQSVLGSEEKRKTLAALPDEMVNGIFANFGSCNQSFSAYMKWRARHQIGNEAHPVFGEDPLQPMIFRPPTSYPSVAETSDQATAELRQLLNAQALLLSQPNRANEALETLRSVLTSYASAAERPADVTPLVGHFVSLLARTHWMHGDAETARGVVEFGLKLAASDPQLRYLQRVMAPKDKIPL